MILERLGGVTVAATRPGARGSARGPPDRPPGRSRRRAEATDRRLGSWAKTSTSRPSGLDSTVLYKSDSVPEPAGGHWPGGTVPNQDHHSLSHLRKLRRPVSLTEAQAHGNAVGSAGNSPARGSARPGPVGNRPPPPYPGRASRCQWAGRPGRRGEARGPDCRRRAGGAAAAAAQQPERPLTRLIVQEGCSGCQANPHGGGGET